MKMSYPRADSRNQESWSDFYTEASFFNHHNMLSTDTVFILGKRIAKPATHICYVSNFVVP